MDPYRGEAAAGALPPIPVDGIVRPLLSWVAGAVAATGAAIGTVVLLGGAAGPPQQQPASPDFTAAALIKLSDDELASRAGHDVDVSGIVRELRSDSFGHRYVELGASTAWAPAVVQCYLADPDAPVA